MKENKTKQWGEANWIKWEISLVLELKEEDPSAKPDSQRDYSIKK